MNTKLTLRVDDKLVKRAKRAARRRGKSVSAMVTEYFDSLDRAAEPPVACTPLTAALAGILKGHSVSRADYQAHLRKKYM